MNRRPDSTMDHIYKYGYTCMTFEYLRVLKIIYLSNFWSILNYQILVIVLFLFF